MRWIEITVTTTEEASDAICEMLAQMGADGISVCDPYEIKRIIEDPDSLAYADDGYVDSLGTDVIVRGYFAEFDEGIRLGAKEEEYFNPEGVGTIYANISSKTFPVDEAMDLVKRRIESIAEFLDIGKGFDGYRYVKDEDWENSWKKDYKAFMISRRVEICPSWETPISEDNVVIMLDPGSAFGSGTHETTSLCASILDDIVSEDDVVLDLGTGSGILAIICEKLGAKEVDAYDIDRLAVDVARENCMNNGCDSITCKTGELKDISESNYSIIVANIIADVICAIAKDVPSHLSKEGKFVCSGIVNSKKEMVRKALFEAGLNVEKEVTKNDWVAFLCSLA